MTFDIFLFENHQFLRVRNNVENKGHIVTKFGEVFSPEQVKTYQKLGHTITPDSNIHGDKTTHELLKRKK